MKFEIKAVFHFEIVGVSLFYVCILAEEISFHNIEIKCIKKLLLTFLKRRKHFRFFLVG